MVLPAAARADAIVVIGGVTGLADPPRAIHLTQGAERLTHGAVLYRQGRAPLVIASGGRPPGVRAATDASESQEMSALPELMGVPKEAIVEDDRSRTTDESRSRSPRSWPRHLHRVLLVTSAWHLPRAVMLFGRHGLDPIHTHYREHPGTGFVACEASWIVESKYTSPRAKARKQYATRRSRCRNCGRKWNSCLTSAQSTFRLQPDMITIPEANMMTR
jgi:hypothetical protein